MNCEDGYHYNSATCDCHCNDEESGDGGDENAGDCILDCPGFGPEPGDDEFCEWLDGTWEDACLDDCDG